MGKSALLGGLILLFLISFGCQTLMVREAESPAGPAGVYLAKSSTPQGDVTFTLTINSDGTGTIDSQLGTNELSNIRIDGNKFNFNSTINAQGRDFSLAFEGVVDGDNISGSVRSQMGSFPFSGQRKQENI